MKASETVCYNIKTAWHAIFRMYNAAGLKHDITTSIGFVLLNIDAREGTPATKIAPLIGLETRSLTRMLRSLEEQGVIYRQADLNDRRMVRIFLTEEGKQKREKARLAVLNFNHLVKARIPDEKLQIFFEVVREIQTITENTKYETA
ncbi:MAG: MarR family transcriptional regulator [Bacteroidetes bacterium]|nr:MarR family transcriptional regulator [Bacteroidota bacterium]